MTINLHIPQSWNELKPNQLKRISYLLHKGYETKMLKILLFISLLNLKWYQFLKQYKVYLVFKTVPISELTNHFKFIYIKTDLTTFIPINKKGWDSPADRLGNITIDELAHADDAYLKYHHTKNIEYLRLLTAVLYRETTGYGLRKPFIKEELTSMLKALKKIDNKSLLAIMRSYQGCRNHIENKFPKIFPKRKNKTKKKKSLAAPSSQFSKIILELTGGKFGNYKETASTNAYLFLADFTNKLTQQKP